MLISRAYAAASENIDQLEALADAPSAGDAFLWNLMLVGILVILFYVLLIMPQQRRFKEHSDMLSSLKKGQKVITGGGLVGKVDKVLDNDEIIIDLGGGMKVTALRSSIQGKSSDIMKPAANDSKKTPPKKGSDSAKSKKSGKKDKKNGN